MRAIVTRWPSLTDPAGRAWEGEWEDLFDRFTVATNFRGDHDHPGWSAAVFDPPHRSLENVRAITAVVLDYDQGEPIESAAALWGEFFGLLHTTRKHTPSSPRFRVILPLTRPVSAFEYGEIWRRVSHRAGGKTDQATKDASRFWFTPGTNGVEYVTRRLTGVPMDPDEVLRSWPTAPVAPVVPIRREPVDDRLERASRYIAKMDPAIAGQGGHAATWAVARKLAQDFGLSESDVFRLLWNEYNPRCQPQWSEKELRHKAREACDKARVSNPVSDRHWDPPPRLRDEAAREPMREPGDDDEPYQPSEEQQSAADRYGIRNVADMLDGVVARAESGVRERGITTGNFELDEIIGGLRRKRITILGADTSFGKSSFGIMVADEAMRSGANVLLVSCEDSEDTYAQRLMARRARVNAFRIRDNELNADDIAKMKAQAARGERAPFFFDAIGKPAEYAAKAVTELCRETDFALVIVDYVQRFSAQRRTQDMRTQVTYVASLFSDAIKNANAAGLILSQLKRPENSTKPPGLHDLKESGDLENMAEHVLLGHLAIDGEGPQRRETRWFYIAKNKDGPRNVERVEVPFESSTASFRTVVGESFDDFGQSGD